MEKGIVSIDDMVAECKKELISRLKGIKDEETKFVVTYNFIEEFDQRYGLVMDKVADVLTDDVGSFVRMGIKTVRELNQTYKENGAKMSRGEVVLDKERIDLLSQRKLASNCSGIGLKCYTHVKTVDENGGVNLEGLKTELEPLIEHNIKYKMTLNFVEGDPNEQLPVEFQGEAPGDDLTQLYRTTDKACTYKTEGRKVVELTNTKLNKQAGKLITHNAEQNDAVLDQIEKILDSDGDITQCSELLSGVYDHFGRCDTVTSICHKVADRKYDGAGKLVKSLPTTKNTYATGKLSEKTD